MSPRRPCANGCGRYAKHRRTKGKRRMGSDKDHDLCPQCAQQIHEQTRSLRLALKRAERGGAVDIDLVRRLKVYLDPSPVFTTAAEEDDFYARRKIEREALVSELNRLLPPSPGRATS